MEAQDDSLKPAVKYILRHAEFPPSNVENLTCERERHRWTAQPGRERETVTGLARLGQLAFGWYTRFVVVLRRPQASLYQREVLDPVRGVGCSLPA